MSKVNLSKNPSFIKSFLTRLQRKKAYFKALEADFVALRMENDLLKKQARL